MLPKAEYCVQHATYIFVSFKLTSVQRKQKHS